MTTIRRAVGGGGRMMGNAPLSWPLVLMPDFATETIGHLKTVGIYVFIGKWWDVIDIHDIPTFLTEIQCMCIV